MSICKECFHSYVCEKFNEHRECDNEKCHFANDHFVSADLINRQKAEIERAEAMIEAVEYHFSPLPFKNKFDEYIEKVKAEAVKVFAEKLKAIRRKMYPCYVSVDLFEGVIDNLVKELTEGKTNE